MASSAPSTPADGSSTSNGPASGTPNMLETWFTTGFASDHPLRSMFNPTIDHSAIPIICQYINTLLTRRKIQTRCHAQPSLIIAIHTCLHDSKIPMSRYIIENLFIDCLYDGTYTGQSDFTISAAEVAQILATKLNTLRETERRYGGFLPSTNRNLLKTMVVWLRAQRAPKTADPSGGDVTPLGPVRLNAQQLAEWAEADRQAWTLGVRKSMLRVVDVVKNEMELQIVNAKLAEELIEACTGPDVEMGGG